jgi:thioredoxin reductase
MRQNGPMPEDDVIVIGAGNTALAAALAGAHAAGA